MASTPGTVEKAATAAFLVPDVVAAQHKQHDNNRRLLLLLEAVLLNFVVLPIMMVEGNARNLRSAVRRPV